MPLYEFRCEKCKKSLDVIRYGDIEAPQCCGQPMIRVMRPPAMIHIKGQGFPARRKWMDNWTPDSPHFSTGSLHGERY